jgi:hypothetical protein
MTKEEFRKVLTETYGQRPYYFRHEPETRQITGNAPGTQANRDSAGSGLTPFYIGRNAAYKTSELIEYGVKRFSRELLK